MGCQSWSSYLEEYQNLVFLLDSPRVVVDNAVSPSSTVVKVDSARKHGILLQAVQILTDLNLSINKAYVSCDARWFMDVFHVTDQYGKKLTDETLISYLQQSLGSINCGKSGDYKGLTVLELTGTDRVGLLSEVFAVLAHLDCNIADAKVWTHNGRIAAIVYVKDKKTGLPIEDLLQIQRIETLLGSVLKGDSDIRSAGISVSTVAATHADRRLHQMMFADRDYERNCPVADVAEEVAAVTVQNWVERGYSVVNVQCRDRTKLLFDVICTLTDMEYVVFHATINTSSENMASLEFYIRHIDGTPINSEAEKQRVIQCLEAAVERRASKGVRLELCTTDRPGLLADVTRTFRENGLNVARAEVSTTMGTAFDVFYVTDAVGNTVDLKIIEAVREKIGLSELQVKEVPLIYGQKEDREEEAVGGVAGAMLFSIGSLVRRNLYNLGLIRSHS